MIQRGVAGLKRVPGQALECVAAIELKKLLDMAAQFSGSLRFFLAFLSIDIIEIIINPGDMLQGQFRPLQVGHALARLSEPLPGREVVRAARGVVVEPEEPRLFAMRFVYQRVLQNVELLLRLFSMRIGQLHRRVDQFQLSGCGQRSR